LRSAMKPSKSKTFRASIAS